MLSDMKLGKRNRQKQPGHEKKKMMHYQLQETESDPHRFFLSDPLSATESE